MKALSLSSLLVLGLAACLAAPACSSSSLSSGPASGAGGDGGDGAGGDQALAGNATLAGQTNQAGVGGAGDVMLDADGCPIGDWQVADGEPCEPPKAECAVYNDCGNGGPVESIECSNGRWEYVSEDGGCDDSCLPGITSAGDSCSDTEEGSECELDQVDDPCQFGHLLICENGKWFDQESFPAPCPEGGAGGGGAGGARGGEGGAP